MIKPLISAGAFALAMIATAPAQAAVFNFTISSARDFASGQFTVADGNSPFTVTGITGDVDGSSITGLSGYGAADQLLSAATPYVDRAGVAFSDGIYDYNIFDNYTDADGHPVYSFCSSKYDGSCTGGSANGAPVARFTITAAGAVPEPASWIMIISGFGGVGGALRRSRKAAKLAGAFA